MKLIKVYRQKIEIPDCVKYITTDCTGSVYGFSDTPIYSNNGGWYCLHKGYYGETEEFGNINLPKNNKWETYIKKVKESE